jgi:CheY-like chemotaxis protein
MTVGTLDANAPLILIVDDVEDTRQLYAAFLQHRGFQTVEADGAKPALTIAAARRPSAIVMDFAMPDGDGLTATRQLTESTTTSHIPVIVLTGHIELVTRDEARAAGARRFITKPCAPEILEGEIRALLAGDTAFRATSGMPQGFTPRP